MKSRASKLLWKEHGHRIFKMWFSFPRQAFEDFASMIVVGDMTTLSVTSRVRAASSVPDCSSAQIALAPKSQGCNSIHLLNDQWLRVSGCGPQVIFV